LWFADLSIDAGQQYFPFIRLALARYQEHSVRDGQKDVCLSPVVMAQMIQLVPERQATLTFQQDDKNSRFTLVVEGEIFQPSQEVFNAGNYIDVWFLDTKLAQPIYGIVDDGKNEKALEAEKIRIKIDDKSISQGRFKISRSFKLPGKYKSAAFQVVIEEYEAPPTRMKVDKEYAALLQDDGERTRLVYADVFRINEIKK
jgi:hypothetical protein